MLRHFVELFDISPTEANHLLDLAIELKRAGPGGLREPRLAGRTLGLVFDKPSMRTRVSFEAAMAHLGGTAIYMSGHDVGLGVREPLSDFGKIISRYVDALAVRTYAQAIVDELVQVAEVPVINALTDISHPCQAMADLMTIREAHGQLEGIRMVFVGDSNNVARSLAVGSALTGVNFVLTCPPGYDYPAEFRDRFASAFPDIPLAVEHDPHAAVEGADIVYTDVWCSMGQEAEAEQRGLAFSSFRVDADLFGKAHPNAIFLHCLPARRGEEVSVEVIDGPRSFVVEQAANRLHFQKALLVWLLGA